MLLDTEERIVGRSSTQVKYANHQVFQANSVTCLKVHSLVVLITDSQGKLTNKAHLVSIMHLVKDQASTRVDQTRTHFLVIDIQQTVTKVTTHSSTRISEVEQLARHSSQDIQGSTILIITVMETDLRRIRTQE